MDTNLEFLETTFFDLVLVLTNKVDSASLNDWADLEFRGINFIIVVDKCSQITHPLVTNTFKPASTISKMS